MMVSNDFDKDYFVAPKNAPVTDYFIAKANKFLPDECIQEGLNYQQKISALNALADQPDLISRIGLKVASPPSEIHSVSGDKQKLGDFYNPDLIVDCLQRNNMTLNAKDRALDFGCSSGRVVRVLKSYYPEVAWFGCDPRQSSVDWANENFPNVTFFTSSETPPLEHLADQSLTGAFAISVWSHFSKPLALRWFEEMARVIKRGGFLIFTTHGYRSVCHFSSVKKTMPQQKANERLRSLKKGAYHFMPYGNKMSGLSLSEWGLAFASHAWYKNNLTKHWEILDFMQGRLMANQDVYLLRRN